MTKKNMKLSDKEQYENFGLRPGRVELVVGSIERGFQQWHQSMSPDVRSIIGLVGMLLAFSSLYFFLPRLQKIAFGLSYGALLRSFIWGIGSGALLLVSIRMFTDWEEADTTKSTTKDTATEETDEASEDDAEVKSEASEEKTEASEEDKEVEETEAKAEETEEAGDDSEEKESEEKAEVSEKKEEKADQEKDSAESKPSEQAAKKPKKRNKKRNKKK